MDCNMSSIPQEACASNAAPESSVLRIPLPKSASQRRLKCVWIGSVASWADDGRLLLNFAHRTGGPKMGRAFELDSRPGEVLLWAWLGRDGLERKRFALAWRGADRLLTPQALPPGQDARQIFLAGGYAEPTDDVQPFREALGNFIEGSRSEWAFHDLCNLLGRFMEDHLLIGAPVPAGQEREELAQRTVDVLMRQAAAWPTLSVVLLEAANVLRAFCRD
jgi:hypothetical protein